MKTILHSLTTTVRKTNTFGYWVNLAIYQIDRARFHQFLMQTTIAFFSFLRYCDLSSYFFSNHTSFLSPSNLPFFPLLSLSSCSFPRFLILRFYFFPPFFDTFTFEEVETHFRHFCFFPIRPRAQFYPENSFPWSFVANRGKIEERIKLPRETRLLWYASKDSIDLVDLAR